MDRGSVRRLARPGSWDTGLLTGVLFAVVVLAETVLHLGLNSPYTYGNLRAYGHIGSDYVRDLEGYLVNRDSFDQAGLAIFLASGVQSSWLMVSRVFYSHLVSLLYPWMGVYEAALLVNVALWEVASLAVWRLALLVGMARAGAFLAGLLTATSVGFITVAGQVISYQGAYCAIALTVYFCARAVYRPGEGPRNPVLAGIVAGAGFLTYELVNLLAFAAVLFLLHRRVRHLLVFLSLALAPALLLHLLNMAVGLRVFHYDLLAELLAGLGHGWTTPLGRLTGYGASLVLGLLQAFVFLTPLLALAGWWSDRDSSRRAFFALLVLVLAVPVALGSNPWPRNYFHAFPGIYILAVAGLFHLGDLIGRLGPRASLARALAIGTGAALALISSHLTVYRYYYYG